MLDKYSKQYLKHKKKKKVSQPRKYVGVMVKQSVKEGEKLALKCDDVTYGEINCRDNVQGVSSNLYEAVEVSKADLSTNTHVESNMAVMSPLKSGDLYGLTVGFKDKDECYDSNSLEESSNLNHILNHLLDNPENLDNIANEASTKLNASFNIHSCESIDIPNTPEAPSTPLSKQLSTPLMESFGTNQSFVGSFPSSESFHQNDDNLKLLSYHSSIVQQQIAEKALRDDENGQVSVNDSVQYTYDLGDQQSDIDVSSPENEYGYVSFIESDDDNPVVKDISIYDIESESMNENVVLPKSYRGLNFSKYNVPKPKKGQGSLMPVSVSKVNKLKKTKTGKNKGYVETLKCEVGKNIYRFLATHHKIRGIYLNKGKRHVKRNLVELKRTDTAVDQGSWKRGNAINDRNRLDDYFEYTDEGRRKKKMLDKKMARDEFVVNWYLFCPGRGNCKRACGGHGKCINGEFIFF